MPDRKLDLDKVRPDLLTPHPPRKTKLDGSPTWDQLHAPFRYDLTDPEVYYTVAGLATQLGVRSISTVAAQLLDFALEMADQGQVNLKVNANRIPIQPRQQLVWEKANLWTQEIKPDRERKQRRRRLTDAASKPAAFGFRWGKERHARVKSLAEQHGCTLGETVTRLLAYALTEYRAGHLKLDFQPAADEQVG